MQKYTDHDIKEAVFYSQVKPQLLIGILTDILNSSQSESTGELQTKVSSLETKVSNLEKEATTLEGKVTTLDGTTVPNLTNKVTALEEKVSGYHPA